MLSHTGSVSYKRFGDRPFLVVDWMTTGIVLSEVTSSGGKATVSKSIYEPWPDGLDPIVSSDQAGLFLKSVCEAGRFPSAAVVVSVPRRDISFKLQEIPNVSDDELGPLLALQVESRSQANGQPVAWDILPHAVSPSASKRHVTLVTVSSSVIQAIQQAASNAGWSHLVITSGDLLIRCADQESSSEWSLYVQANRAKLELLLCYQGVPVASHASAMPAQANDGQSGSPIHADSLQSLAGRLMAACPSEWKGSQASVLVVVCGTYADEIVAELRSAGIDSRILPSDERSLRALGIAGSLTKIPATSERTTPCRIDFLRPRSSDPRITARKRRGIRLSAVAGALIFFGILGMWLEYQSLQQQLTEQETQRQQLQQYVDRGKMVVNQWEYVSRWQRESLALNQEIADLANVLPSRERLILTRLQLENLVDSETGMLRMDGLCEDVEDVLTMNSAILEKSDQYDLRPQGIEPASADSEFPSRFRIEAELKRSRKPSLTEESR